MSTFSQLLPLIAAFYGFLWLYMRQKRKEEWAEIRANMRRNGLEMDEFGRLVDRDGMPLLDAEGRMVDGSTGLEIGPQTTDEENAETMNDVA
ncbi:hypothetical protein EV714DRAFT_276160 [Schizophyllum commune]